MKKIIVGVAVVLALSVLSVGEDRRSEISLQGAGFFTKEATNKGQGQDATHTGGYLTGYRYYLNSHLGVEANYGYARNTQRYNLVVGPARVQTNVHEVTGALVVRSRAIAEKFHAFGLAGGGALIFDPTNNAGGTFPGVSSETKGAFLYGGGVDYDLTSRFALRTEYRGLVYNSPRFNVSALDIDKITHLAQPSAGVVFRF